MGRSEEGERKGGREERGRRGRRGGMEEGGKREREEGERVGRSEEERRGGMNKSPSHNMSSCPLTCSGTPWYRRSE